LLRPTPDTWNLEAAARSCGIAKVRSGSMLSKKAMAQTKLLAFHLLLAGQ
jgi:hypothetical protein